MAGIIFEHLKIRAAYLLPLSEWSIPKSQRHQKERELHLQFMQKVSIPLGCSVADSPSSRSPIDMIIDDICVQNKTAYASDSSRALRINTYKHGGTKMNGNVTMQPYNVDDGIDAIIVNVQRCGELVGLFIFPKDEMMKRGWLQGNGHSGKIFIYLFPPYICPRKGYESLQTWQLDYYLDLSEKVDLDRARMLFDRCKKEENRL
eukprot:GEMP01032382.1.p1 GENE.GEMP01032382.1~~GEMP01032382.1.p1  ORF type:complete len:204 (+),score=22.20 GEMP01032382.1:1011-1622(+)